MKTYWHGANHHFGRKKSETLPPAARKYPSLSSGVIAILGQYPVNKRGSWFLARLLSPRAARGVPSINPQDGAEEMRQSGYGSPAGMFYNHGVVTRNEPE